MFEIQFGNFSGNPMTPNTHYTKGKNYALKFSKQSAEEKIGLIEKEKNFVFIGTQKGDGITHFVFKSIAGGYLISYTATELKLNGN